MAIRNVSHLPLSLSLRVFPLFPFAVIFSSAFFSLFPSLGLFDLRAEAKGRAKRGRTRLKSEQRINCAYRGRQLTQLMAQCAAQGRRQKERKGGEEREVGEARLAKHCGQ